MDLSCSWYTSYYKIDPIICGSQNKTSIPFGPSAFLACVVDALDAEIPIHSLQCGRGLFRFLRAV